MFDFVIWFVFPFRLQSCLVAVVVPEKDPVQKWAEKNDAQGNLNSWCTNEVQIYMRSYLTGTSLDHDTVLQWQKETPSLSCRPNPSALFTFTRQCSWALWSLLSRRKMSVQQSVCGCVTWSVASLVWGWTNLGFACTATYGARVFKSGWRQRGVSLSSSTSFL